MMIKFFNFTILLNFILISFLTTASFAQLRDTLFYNPKKGYDISTHPNNGCSDWIYQINSLNVYWHYRWGNTLPDGEPDSVEWVPLIYSFLGDTSDLASKINYVNNMAEQGRVHYLLGFNEPDNSTQANMTVNEAVDAWPIMMRA